MARSKKSKTEHDKEVKDLAKKYKNKGYNVEADIPGWEQPDTIGGYRPDLTVEKGGQNTTIEVETPDSVDSKRDIEQQRAFKKWRNRKDNRHYKRIVTKQ